MFHTETNSSRETQFRVKRRKRSATRNQSYFDHIAVARCCLIPKLFFLPVGLDKLKRKSTGWVDTHAYVHVSLVLRMAKRHGTCLGYCNFKFCHNPNVLALVRVAVNLCQWHESFINILHHTETWYESSYLFHQRQWLYQKCTSTPDIPMMRRIYQSFKQHVSATGASVHVKGKCPRRRVHWKAGADPGLRKGPS